MSTETSLGRQGKLPRGSKATTFWSYDAFYFMEATLMGESSGNKIGKLSRYFREMGNLGWLPNHNIWVVCLYHKNNSFSLCMESIRITVNLVKGIETPEYKVLCLLKAEVGWSYWTLTSPALYPAGILFIYLFVSGFQERMKLSTRPWFAAAAILSQRGLWKAVWWKTKDDCGR